VLPLQRLNRQVSKQRHDNSLFYDHWSGSAWPCDAVLLINVHRKQFNIQIHYLHKKYVRNIQILQLKVPGIQSRWRARFSAPVQTGPGAHPASCTMGTGSFTGVKSGRGVTLTPYRLLVPWSWKSRPIPLLPLWTVRPVQSLSACARVHFTFTLPTQGKHSWLGGLRYIYMRPTTVNVFSNSPIISVDKILYTQRPTKSLNGHKTNSRIPFFLVNL